MWLRANLVYFILCDSIIDAVCKHCHIPDNGVSKQMHLKHMGFLCHKIVKMWN